MQKLLFFLLVGICCTCQAQESDSLRLIKGKITYGDNIIAIGETVREFNTSNGAITTINGEFELFVHRNRSVYLIVSGCFSSWVFEYKPDKNYKVLRLNKANERKSKKLFKKLYRATKK